MLRKPPRMSALHKTPQRKAKATVKKVRTGASITENSYDPATKELKVTFHHGKSYTYKNVPEEFADGFRDAESKGKYLHSNIIGKYETLSST